MRHRAAQQEPTEIDRLQQYVNINAFILSSIRAACTSLLTKKTAASSASTMDI